MNERIKELKIQACKWASENATVTEYENAADQKFAELIWQAAYEEGHDVGVDAGFEAGRNASFTEQHFGVKE